MAPGPFFLLPVSIALATTEAMRFLLVAPVSRFGVGATPNALSRATASTFLSDAHDAHTAPGFSNGRLSTSKLRKRPGSQPAIGAAPQQNPLPGGFRSSNSSGFNPITRSVSTSTSSPMERDGSVLATGCSGPADFFFDLLGGMVLQAGQDLLVRPADQRVRRRQPRPFTSSQEPMSKRATHVMKSRSPGDAYTPSIFFEIRQFGNCLPCNSVRRVI